MLQVMLGTFAALAAAPISTGLAVMSTAAVGRRSYLNQLTEVPGSP
jgi:hypothetical protein